MIAQAEKALADMYRRALSRTAFGKPLAQMGANMAPNIAMKVTDAAVQMFGAQSVSQDTELARQWANLRTLRLADGPDAVHRRHVAHNELRRNTQDRI